MLELTGKCCGGIEAIEFMESLADIIPEDDRTNEFCEEFSASLNRFRYEVSKGIGTKKKIVKAVCKGHRDLQYCGKCGFEAEEPGYSYCPNCGTKYLKERTERSERMSDKVIAIMNKPKDCENCVFGVCKYSMPLSTSRKGYYCNLKEPKDITVEDFFHTDKVRLKNCPLISDEEHDKEIRDKAIEEFCNFIHEKAKENNGLRLSSETRSWTHASIYYYFNEFKEKQMKEVGE